MFERDVIVFAYRLSHHVVYNRCDVKKTLDSCILINLLILTHICSEDIVMCYSALVVFVGCSDCVPLI